MQNKDNIKSGFLKAKETYNNNAIVQDFMRSWLFNALKKYQNKRHLGAILELGCGGGELYSKIAKHYTFSHYCAIDLVDFSKNFKKATFIQGDFENLELLKHQSFDIILSNAALQWSNQREFLPQLLAHLNKQGILLFSTFGKENYKQFRTLFNIGLEYLSLQDYREIFDSCTILESFEMTKTLKFSSAKEVFKHLQNTGVNTLERNFILKKEHLKKYSENFANILTYHMLFLLVEKPF